MTDTDAHLRVLERRVAGMEKELKSLRSDLERFAKSFLRCDDIQDKFRRLADRQITDLYQRLINIELHLFPNLPTDINRVNQIIGDGDGKAYNARDFREPGKRTPPKDK